MVKVINTTKTLAGKKILGTPCMPITDITPEHEQFIQDLMDTASAHKFCIGLCANQIWDNENVPAPAIFIVPGQNGWAVCINPNIDKTWKKEIKIPEGCMSLPGISEKKARFRHIKVSYYDKQYELVNGIELYDFPARIFQHEMDHIEGRLFNERS